jgi:YHS domain-containing protein
MGDEPGQGLNEPPAHVEILHAPRAAVCHRIMTASLDWYPTAQYQGRTIYFCTEFCLEAFQADPDRFYAAHSRLKK